MAAVNHWGRLGTWDFLVCRDPQLLGQSLSNLATLWEQWAGPARRTARHYVPLANGIRMWQD